MKKFFMDIMAPSGKWSLGRVMLVTWFCIMCWFAISNGRAFGQAILEMFENNASAGSAAVPYLDGFTYYLVGVFIVLCGYVFAGKTSLNAVVNKTNGIQMGNVTKSNGVAESAGGNGSTST